MILRRSLILRLSGRLAVISTLTTLAGVAFLWVKAPPVLAAYCPQCYGFAPFGPQLWVDSPTRAQLLDLGRMTAAAKADVAAVFGPGTTDVTVLMCTTPPCAARMKAPDALGAAYGGVAVLMTPFGIDPIVLRHELTHVARTRVAPRFMRRVLWREEGLAEWVAKGPRVAEDCAPTRALPLTLRDWREAAQVNPSALYAEAHCLMSREIESKGIARVAFGR
jgi:hypothetical protein